MARKITLKANLPKPVQYECWTCKDTGKIVKSAYGRRYENDCDEVVCPVRDKAKAQQQVDVTKARAQSMRQNPCTSCGNRGYIEWADNTRTPCPKNCSCAAVAIAMGLVQP